MSRAAELISKLPLATLSIMSLCCTIYIYQFLFDPPLTHYTMCPREVVYLHDYYRIITSALFHGGFMHITMNMMTTSAIGSLLERRFGTLKYTLTILWGILLTSVVYITVSMLLYFLFGYEKFMYQHSVGFSCVLFQLSVLEANLSPDATRNVFGFFQVPAWAYPWALLVILQIIMPQISFMGHLSGILVGTLQVYGLLDILHPSNEFLRESETTNYLSYIVRKPGFVPIPSDSVLSGLERRNSQGILPLICSAFSWVCNFIKNVAETLKVIIFGNVAISNHGSDWADDDEEEWVVQPVLRNTRNSSDGDAARIV